MKKFLDNVGLKSLIETIQKKYAENLQSSSTDANAGKFTYTVYKDKTGGGIEAETKTIDTGANKVTIAEGSTSGAISVTTNGETASVNVHNVLTSDTAQNISATKTVTTGNKLILVDAPSNDTDAANKGYVDSKILESEAMQYKGSINASSDLPTVANTTNNVKVGATYKVATAGDYSYYNGTSTVSQACKIGDLFIAQAIASGTTKTITWDYIPAANETISLRYSTNANEVNLTTTAQSDAALVVGEAATKEVTTSFSGTYNTDVANGNVPTVGAVTAYALKEVKNATNDSSLTIGTKASGEQTLAVKVKTNSGITSDSNGLSANVNANSGLSINSSTGAIELTTPGNGITVDSTNHKITADIAFHKGLTLTGVTEGSKQIGVNASNGITFTGSGAIIADANTDQGIEVTSDGIGIALSGSGTGEQFINFSGLEFNSDDGKLQVHVGKGLEIDNTTHALSIGLYGSEFINLSGLEFINSNQLAVNAGDGLIINDTTGALEVDFTQLAGSGLKYDATHGELDIELGSGLGGLEINNNVLKVKTGDGIELRDGGYVSAKLNSTNGIKFDSNGKISLDLGNGLTETASGNKLAINNGNGIEFSSGAVAAKANTQQGIEVTNDGIGIALYMGSNTQGLIPASGLEFSDDGKLKVNVGSGTGLEINEDGALTVNAGDGITFDNNGKLKVNAGDGLEFTNDGKLKVDVGSGLEIGNDGLRLDIGGSGCDLEYSPNEGKIRVVVGSGLRQSSVKGIGIDLAQDNSHHNVSGLEFTNDGELKVDAGNGITVDTNGVAVNVDSTNANGLSVGANGLALATATQSTAGAMSATDKTNLDNVKSTYAHSLTATTNSTAGVDLKLNDNSTTPVALSTVNVKGGNGASVDINSGSVAVSAVANSVKGIAVGGSGIGINLKATDSGLAFNTGTGGDNGLYVDALTTQEIEAMWTSSTPPTPPTPEPTIDITKSFDFLCSDENETTNFGVYVDEIEGNEVTWSVSGVNGLTAGEEDDYYGYISVPSGITTNGTVTITATGTNDPTVLGITTVPFVNIKPTVVGLTNITVTNRAQNPYDPEYRTTNTYSATVQVQSDLWSYYANNNINIGINVDPDYDNVVSANQTGTWSINGTSATTTITFTCEVEGGGAGDNYVRAIPLIAYASVDDRCSYYSDVNTISNLAD